VPVTCSCGIPLPSFPILSSQHIAAITCRYHITSAIITLQWRPLALTLSRLESSSFAQRSHAINPLQPPYSCRMLLMSQAFHTLPPQRFCSTSRPVAYHHPCGSSYTASSPAPPNLVSVVDLPPSDHNCTALTTLLSRWSSCRWQPELLFFPSIILDQHAWSLR
jgi:hypothetical protein